MCLTLYIVEILSLISKKLSKYILRNAYNSYKQFLPTYQLLLLTFIGE